MKFETLNRAPDPDDSECHYLELETKLSPKLSDLFVHFISAEQPFYKVQELRAFGVDAIALPDICSLSSKGCHFKPLDSLGSVTATYPPIDTHRNPHPNDAIGSRPIISSLEPIQYGGRNWLFPTKAIEDNGYCPMDGHTFFGVFTGMIKNLPYEVTSHLEWLGPTPGDGNLRQPHMKIYMVTECNGADTIITQGEMGAIMNVFYNRVYEPGFENHSIFPVLVISEYFWRRVRIIEAVFDRSRERFTVKFTPICHFGRRDDLLWDLFLRYEGSEPQNSQ
ncbi:hypothetical protein N7494_000272 [Penicillium frequentans]|uniref:Uncharacterized protein n=1 Tax=Penicillium frequentans TaxID=3151616 RepID=A0AAD6D5L4_9EURO|nr:hypothetical protein N7494_000272 [Penicillium glabrum]